MKINEYKWSENKILLVSNPFMLIEELRRLPNALILTPNTLLKDVLKTAANSIFMKYFHEKYGSDMQLIINEKILTQIVNYVNEAAGEIILKYDIDFQKLFHQLISVRSDETINFNHLEFILKLMEKYTTKEITIFLVGFENNINKLITKNYRNINLIRVINDLPSAGLDWNILLMLVIKDDEDMIEIIDLEKLKVFLELKSKTILRMQDINDFMNNHVTFQTYLIQRSFKKINN